MDKNQLLTLTLNEIDQAIKNFGQYHFDTHVADESMDFSSIMPVYNKLNVEDSVWFLINLLEAPDSKVATSQQRTIAVTYIVGDSEDKPGFMEILQADPRIQDVY